MKARIPLVLLPYQQRWTRDNSRVKVCEKSRRIGLSWADAAIAALEAAKTRGNDTFYIGYNREMAEQYIEDVAFWAKHYQAAASHIETVVLKDEDKDILVYRVRFASGYKVQALSSRPSNLRAKQGSICIDEAAFHDDLEELLKAAMAILAWGGQVRIISTHNGEDNAFNQLIKRIRAAEVDYSLHRVTLEEAIKDGLYKRICLVRNIPWTLEGEFAWFSQLYKDYGIGAEEELGCNPFSAKGGGKVFKREWFEVVDSVPSGGVTVRFYDLAATAADMKKDAFYTAGVKMKRIGNTYYVLDLIAEQLSPADSDSLIVATAQQDSKNVRVRWEKEGGSAGLRDEVHLKSLLKTFDAKATRPLGDKVLRCKPMASEAMRGNVKLLRGDWNDRYLSALYGFDGTPKPLVNDIADSSSGAFTELSRVSAIASPHAKSYRTW
ncbi:MAG: terminase large subunit domain-containing protein [Chroococcidiopsis sp.]